MSVHVHYEGAGRCPICADAFKRPFTERHPHSYHVHVGEVAGGFHVSVSCGGLLGIENWASGTEFLSWWRKPLQILTVCGFNYVYQYPKAWRLPPAIKAAQRFCEIEQAKEERTHATLRAMSKARA